MGPVPGDVERGEVECVRGEARAVSAEVVAPGLEVEADVVMVRGCEGEDAVVWALVCGCCEEEGEGVLPCWMAEWALNAARKLAKKGR